MIVGLWRRAQCASYGKSVQKVKGVMSGIFHELDQARSVGYDPNKFVKKGLLHLRNARNHLDMDTLDPFTWAPFVIIGNGDRRLNSSHFQR